MKGVLKKRLLQLSIWQDRFSLVKERPMGETVNLEWQEGQWEMMGEISSCGYGSIIGSVVSLGEAD